MRSRLFLFGRSLSLLCWVTLLFVGCQKEYGAKRFSIFTESYRGAAKVVVDGLSSSWRAGDGIWVNGEQGSVALDNNGAPILDVSVTNWEYGYYASYPASSVVAGARDGTLTLTLPQAYQYREDATTHKQLLEMPMVAYTEYDRLEFKHLTGALVVKVPSVSSTIRLDYIMVHSSTSPLSGTGTVDAGAESPQMVFGSDTTHTVVMYFDRCAVDIAAGAAEKSIMIPVAPTTGNDHKFTVTVCAHTTGSTRNYYFFNKEQESSGRNLSRNEVAAAKVSLSTRTIPLVGDGSDVTPYLIQNKVDYKNFLSCIRKGDGNDRWYKMVNDIDFGGDTVTTVPLSSVFSGRFNGNGKGLKNVYLEGASFYPDYYLSLFPPITDGWVKNLSISNVRFIYPVNGTFTNFYVGGLSSIVKLYENGVLLENIHVSNIDFDIETSKIFKINNLVAVGGIIGRLIESSGTAGPLSMNNCFFSQPLYQEFNVKTGWISLSFGGMIGDANGADVTLSNCHIDFGGSRSVTGITIKTSGPTPYIGSVIGQATSNTVQMSTSLLLEGHVQFIGSPLTNVKRIIGNGNSANISVSGTIHMNDLFLLGRIGTNSPNDTIIVNY